MLLACLAEKLDITLRGLVSKLAERGVTVTVYASGITSIMPGLSFKKTLHAAEQDRPDMMRKRAPLAASPGQT
jgi:hypothetical protein